MGSQKGRAPAPPRDPFFTESPFFTLAVKNGMAPVTSPTAADP